MGCFSYLCKKCGKPIKSDSFRGERCVLFLIEDGNVKEHMIGEYDSYGRVFDSEGESIEWTEDWQRVVDLHFYDKRDNGIAAFHTRCYDGELPVERSYDDPDQGWGSFHKVKVPFIKPKCEKKFDIEV